MSIASAINRRSVSSVLRLDHTYVSHPITENKENGEKRKKVRKDNSKNNFNIYPIV